MGALFAGVCYPTLSQAQNEFCSTWHAGYSTATEAVELRCGAVSTDHFDIAKFVNGQVQTPTTPGAYPDFPACDYSGGAALASDWAAVFFVVLVIIYCGKSLIRLFEFHHERE